MMRAVSRTTHTDFRGIQILRGLAACMVVVYHATQSWGQHTGNLSQIWNNGQFGVDIFFVISGFVMVVSTRNKPAVKHPGARFLERRVVRVVPLYWMLTAIMVWKDALAAAVPAVANLGPHSVLTPAWIYASLAFIPYQHALGDIRPVLAVGWTLNFEMFFYALFALALTLKISPLKLLAPVLTALVIFGTMWHGYRPAAAMLASPLLLEFLSGMLIAYCIPFLEKLSRSFSVLLALAALGTLATFHWPALASIGWMVRIAAATLLVAACIALEPLFARSHARLALGIGDASYSLYLVHLLVFAFVTKVLFRLGLLAGASVQPAREAAVVILYFVPTLLIALALYRWVEAPMNNWLRRNSKLREAQMQPVLA